MCACVHACLCLRLCLRLRLRALARVRAAWIWFFKAEADRPAVPAAARLVGTLEPALCTDYEREEGGEKCAGLGEFEEKGGRQLPPPLASRPANALFLIGFKHSIAW